MPQLRSVISYLEADHARLHALLARAMAAPRLDLQAFAEFRGRLLRHIAIEEKVLLPAAREARAGVALGRARELRVDHGALASLLVPTPDLALCSEILSLLSVHDAKEEGRGGVYEECRRLLRGSELARLGERAVSFPKVRLAQHFDGPNVFRTAEEALASARRMGLRTPSHGEDQ